MNIVTDGRVIYLGKIGRYSHYIWRNVNRRVDAVAEKHGVGEAQRGACGERSYKRPREHQDLGADCKNNRKIREQWQR